MQVQTLPPSPAPVKQGLAGKGIYDQITRRKYLILLALAVGLIALFLLDVSLGPARLSIGEVALGIVNPAAVSPESQVIIWDVRLPIALMAIVVGASLALAGAEMQTILNNPLASPFTLGVSAAASFGASLAIVLGFSIIPFAGTFLITANAFVCAMFASFLIYGVSRMKGVTTETMVLLGIALVFLFSSGLALMQYLASEQTLQQLVFWSLGSLAKATWPKIGITAIILLLTIPVLAVNVWKLTALRLGDEKARAMGVDVDRLRLNIVILVSVLAASAVSFVGIIGFVGLVGPHIARFLVGEDQRYFLPVSALAGALLMAATSIVSKSIIPGVLVPAGIITSLIGVPFFISMILSRRRQMWQ